VAVSVVSVVTVEEKNSSGHDLEGDSLEMTKYERLEKSGLNPLV
jgi:hypothetical protein